MRTVVPIEHWSTVAQTGTQCCIPATVTRQASVRLFRVDIYPQYGLLPSKEETLHWKLVRLVGNIFLKALRSGTLADASPGYAAVKSAGTYDGFALEIKDFDNIPMLPHALLFHCVHYRYSERVLRLAFVGPAIFHPVRVSTNVPTTHVSNSNRTLAAVFPACETYCL